ncbi:MAG: hypothetical protein EOO39_47960 [Cytophagaceae bacterium]|nr:MAG: hypothetical protein EOO39_47960 [Cytophagaceae bacterium]
MKSRKGMMWVGSNGGLYNVHPVTLKVRGFATHPVLKVLENKRVTRLYEANDNRLWVATASHGLFIYDPERETLVNYTTENGLPSNTINAITGDQSGNVYVGSNTGFSVINDDGQMLHYTYNNGLRYYNCQDILYDSLEGTIWIANTNCLIRFNPADCVRLITAALVAQYTATSASPRRPAWLAMLMILPPWPWRIICRAAACKVNSVPATLIENSRS